ncbi:putative transcriptional regulator (plasmid) [Leptolyngbya boryana NIES-2135]|jgi:DNA-binding MarR family transcriptional regulator|uniref:Putative transcriptional regulator n=1 Tax=Leptolyngbya boryana NIES-2135 TaxID=1973484 RepID=A0A1Z4JSR0_LEPBY|nr:MULTISPECIES: MarR family transcriptional regulator [Leptolyngbya]BAY59811.1 putative transcriptional regulator [Leptolyngbya boryana NIES-2135]MBD2369635.1 MarR family transcriptional regulator [Leptolyngbya sp. FACHB-161]MBD2375920.1 MarR family transcriptional regulator [Leptolyngbya sp. FACHB-238]MBD2400196.1 MarR family transcriptional regulator [Leptolyngbya sp. FACHB-239]MBD2406737.1 MarR family transcriptional regulator [Leptolyngbya sp. FACHB-402]
MIDLNDLDHQREQELNKALEALHFAFRAVIAKPDAILAERGLSRVHHRILYFVGRHPGLSVNNLLTLLNVSKQSLNAPLRQLTQLGLIESNADENDRRVKRLTLTRQGLYLEQKLSGDQRQRFARVFETVGQEGEAIWHQVMKLLAEDIFPESDELEL